MANREEMLEWLNTNHRELSDFRNAEGMQDSDLDTLFNSMGGYASTWTELFHSEKEQFMSTFRLVEKALILSPHYHTTLSKRPDEMQRGWLTMPVQIPEVLRKGKGDGVVKLGISKSGMMSLDGSPFYKSNNTKVMLLTTDAIINALVRHLKIFNRPCEPFTYTMLKADIIAINACMAELGMNQLLHVEPKGDEIELTMRDTSTLESTLIACRKEPASILVHVNDNIGIVYDAFMREKHLD